jgi:hypothetical protein
VPAPPPASVASGAADDGSSGSGSGPHLRAVSTLSMPDNDPMSPLGDNDYGVAEPEPADADETVFAHFGMGGVRVIMTPLRQQRNEQEPAWLQEMPDSGAASVGEGARGAGDAAVPAHAAPAAQLTTEQRLRQEVQKRRLDEAAAAPGPSSLGGRAALHQLPEVRDASLMHWRCCELRMIVCGLESAAQVRNTPSFALVCGVVTHGSRMLQGPAMGDAEMDIVSDEASDSAGGDAVDGGTGLGLPLHKNTATTPAPDPGGHELDAMQS